jgi:hypothetical protein
VERQTQAVFVFIRNRVFRADALFIRTENAVGAQSAQWLPPGNRQTLRDASNRGARSAQVFPKPRLHSIARI